MRRNYQILPPLLSLFLVRVDLTDLIPMTYEVRLIRLLDADTAKVSLGRRILNVRIGKLDAPEKGQPFLNGRGDAGRTALRCAADLIGSKKYFSLKIVKYDIYGRVLGDLDQLSFDFVKAGCATLYPFAEFSSRSEKWSYIRALNRAKLKNIGLWKFSGFRQPKLWRKESYFRRRK